MQLSIEAKRICREVAGSRNNMQVDVIDGNDAPCVTGQPWHYTTLSGSPIYHPSAYSRRGWSNMRYHPSTLSVEVGRDWLLARGLLELPIPDCESIHIPADSRELSLAVA